MGKSIEQCFWDTLALHRKPCAVRQATSRCPGHHGIVPETLLLFCYLLLGIPKTYDLQKKM
jgi:hypothetical protein